MADAFTFAIPVRDPYSAFCGAVRRKLIEPGAAYDRLELASKRGTQDIHLLSSHINRSYSSDEQHIFEAGRAAGRLDERIDQAHRQKRPRPKSLLEKLRFRTKKVKESERAILAGNRDIIKWLMELHHDQDVVDVEGYCQQPCSPPPYSQKSSALQ